MSSNPHNTNESESLIAEIVKDPIQAFSDLEQDADLLMPLDSHQHALAVLKDIKDKFGDSNSRLQITTTLEFQGDLVRITKELRPLINPDAK